MVTICGSGLAPPNGIVKDKAGTVWNVWAWSGLGRLTIKAKATRAKRTCNGLDFETRLLIGMLHFLQICVAEWREAEPCCVSAAPLLPVRRLYSLRIALIG